MVLAVAVAGLGLSPSEASATESSGGFTDDDGGFAEPALDALAQLGVLEGTECGQALICPDDPIPRWMMAVWLVRMVDGADPDRGDPVGFVDVDPETWWAPFVDRLFELGITTACATEPMRFCGDRSVTRAQMAVFLVRAFDLRGALGDVGFSDISGSYAHDHINALATAGITTGCGTDPLRYCPTREVTRGQMAVFLARTVGLVELPASVRFTAIDAGPDHTCGLRADATMSCWGQNTDGQADAPSGEFAAVAAGARHSCGLRDDGTAVCWGANNYRQANAPLGEFAALSVGGAHTCGLRADNTIVCWGANYDGQASALSGEFVTLSAGAVHTCGLRADATAVCWGNNDHGRSDALPGEFAALAAGGAHTCGLRTDNTIVCWGANHAGQADAPDGEFIQVSVGPWHACGVQASGSVQCWGSNFDGQAERPDGHFTAVATGERHSCGLRANGTVVCWGDLNTVAHNVPEGQFNVVSIGRAHACAIRTGDTVACWGHQGQGRSHPPEDPFKDISAGQQHTCGIRTDGTVACWGNGSLGQTSEPTGDFTRVTVGPHHTCGLRTDNRLICWGANHVGQVDAPDGEFTAVTAGSQHTCGLRTDGAVECWGANHVGQADAPDGEFTAVTAGAQHTCGLRTDNTIACWGANHVGQVDAPDGEFTAVTAGSQHACGLRTDGAVECWGGARSDTSPPNGPFRAVSAGDEHTCGLRADNSIACWGARHVDPPIGVGAPAPGPGQPDPSRCRPYGVLGVTTAGFPLPRWAAPSTGTLRVAVVFVDFPDAAASHSTHREAELGLPYVEQYLEAASYGRFDVEFEPLHRWLRAVHPHAHYLSPGVLSGARIARAINDEAVRLADPLFDFSDYDALMVVMPSSRFGGGNAGGRVETQEGTVVVTRINTFVHEPQEPYRWGSTGAHELAHNLGLLDLYPYDDAPERPDAPGGMHWVEAEFGLMRLHAFFVASEYDERLAHEWIQPSGRRYIRHRFYLDAAEMLAWSRWQLGWLDETQIRCVTGGVETVALAAAAEPGDGIAMAAVPLGAHEVIVVESRRKIGHDAGQPYVAPSGVRTTFPALAAEGVLVYTVDASLGSGKLPIRVAQDSGDITVDDYPVLQPGQSVTVRGYMITVISDDGDTHTVTISKVPA